MGPIGVLKYSQDNTQMKFSVRWHGKQICVGIHNFETGKTWIKDNPCRYKNKEKVYELLMTNDLHYKVKIINNKKYRNKCKAIKWSK